MHKDMEEQIRNKVESLQMWFEDFTEQWHDEDKDISDVATSLSLISRRAIELQNLILENAHETQS
jgi:hypothetical protein